MVRTTLASVILKLQLEHRYIFNWTTSNFFKLVFVEPNTFIDKFSLLMTESLSCSFTSFVTKPFWEQYQINLFFAILTLNWQMKEKLVTFEARYFSERKNFLQIGLWLYRYFILNKIFYRWNNLVYTSLFCFLFWRLLGNTFWRNIFWRVSRIIWFWILDFWITN